MNMALQHYLTLRAGGQGAWLRETLGNWLNAVGTPPEVYVRAEGDHASSVRVFRYRSGRAHLVGLLRSHKRLFDESDAFVDRAPRPFTLHWGRRGHIYDVIHRQYHGEGGRLQLQIPAATPFLWALFPYQVTAVQAVARQQERTVEVNTTVQVSEGSADRHVMRVQVTDAEGHPRPEYEDVVEAPEGRATHTFPLALNDPPGRWVIEVEEVATGITGRETIQISPPME